MTITAKFPGTCSACNCRIEAGEKIEWARGNGVRHATVPQCADAKQHRDAQKTKTPIDLPKLNLQPLVTFLEAARDRGLKYPKVRVLDIDGRTELRISLTTRGNSPGSLSVKREWTWLGYVKPSGEMTNEVASSVPLQAHLSQVAKDPAHAMKDYAAIMCQCGFCGKPLTDAGSVDVGYGPVCAKHWGLPHSALGTSVLRPVPGAML